MNRRSFLRGGASAFAGASGAKAFADSPFFRGDVPSGPFLPFWESLKSYRCPEWFRDAKFGIWAHWSPQCVPEQGDWYARNMYIQGSGQYEYHVKNFGHPSQFGYKDICHLWKAEKWEPDALIKMYKRAGAEYLVALATHHDNFDCWNSKYQPWNSVAIGPKKDLVSPALLAQAAAAGLSVHPWTVDDADEIRKLILSGVASITTNAPDEAILIRGGADARETGLALTGGGRQA